MSTCNILFHACPIMLDIGSIILPGNWGRIEKTILGPGSPILFREYLLESVRKEYFPDKPSRMESTFSCPDLQSMVTFMEANCSTSLCYEVEHVSPEKPFHLAPCDLVGPASNQNTWEWASAGANRYWSWNPNEYLTPMEIVSLSPLKVLGRGKNLPEVIELLAHKQTSPASSLEKSAVL